MRIAVVICSIALTGIFPAYAQESTATVDSAETRTLDPIVVTGVSAGPGLWKVSKGDHALWILGTVSPVPKKMQWYSPQTETVLRQAKMIIGRPQAGMHVGWGSAFKVAFAMPTILRARELPDGKSLHDVLPPELYARWLTLKSAYLGKDSSIEHWRPIFAAGKLYQAALDGAGLQPGTGTGKRIDELADEYKISQSSNLISYEITDPKGLAKSFAKADIDDVACFRSVLDRLEQDVAHAASRANAWAIGDIPELTRLVQRDRIDLCMEAVEHVEAMQSMGVQDAVARAEAKWMSSVDDALAANQVSFATLPMNEMLDSDGLLARLSRKGYDVQAPQ